MKTAIIIITILLVAIPSSWGFAKDLQPDDILTVVNSTNTNIQSEVERLIRISPHGLSSSNSVVVFRHGPRLRPSLLSLVQSSEKEISFGAKQWLASIGDHRDLNVIHKSNWLRIPERNISDPSLDTVVTQTMEYIVERENDQLRPPKESHRIVNAAETAALATCVTSSRVNNHGRYYVMHYSKDNDKWKLQYYDLALIE